MSGSPTEFGDEPSGIVSYPVEEDTPVSLEVYEPSQPWDDDCMRLVWNPSKGAWSQYYWVPFGGTPSQPNYKGPLTKRAGDAILRECGKLNPQELERLAAIVQRSTFAHLEARSFFLSWYCVVVLAFRGFPISLLQVKDSLHGSFGLPPEKPGSKWPKTTLGALRLGRSLSFGEVKRLRSICRQADKQLRGRIVNVRSLLMAIYYSRSLEQRLLTQRLHLGGAIDPDASQVPTDHQREVQDVMDQFSDNDDELRDYYEQRLSIDGQREPHYRDPELGTTLIFDLGDQLLPIIEDFIRSVDMAFPGYYSWFAPESRHVTVRGLRGT